MAAILKLRRGTSIPSLQQSELFYHSSLNTLVVGDGSNSHILLKSGSNTVDTVNISGTVSASYIHVANDLTIKGNIILGDEIANDNITINAELSGSLIPDADNTHDLGTLSKKYRNLYINSLPGSNIISSSAQISGYNSFLEINGDSVVSSSAQISGYNSFLEINGDSVVSSSAQISGYNKFLEINGDSVVSSSAQIDSLGFLKVNGDNVFSSSVQVNANTITNFDSNVKDKLNIEDVISGSSQITDGSNIVSSSAQISGYDVFLEKDGNNVVSSSAQISGYDKFLEKDGDNVFSSSVQVNANTITNFDSNVKTKLNDDNVHSGSFLGTATTANLSENTNLYYTDTRVKSKLNTEGVLSGSSQLTTEFDSRYLNTNGDNVFSSSVQVNANTITNFDSNVKTKMNSDGVISGSGQLDNVFLEINGDNVVTSSAQISGYNKFLEINGDNVVSGSTQVNSLFEGTAVSTSLDARLDSLEIDIHTHSNKSQLDTINQNLSTTSNVTFNTGSFTGDVTITGDFTVLGSATEISSTELRIEDKLITVASGSVDSAAADGAGIEIDGANKSIQWDHNTTSFVLDAKVSSSVGFKGEGGELTGIDTDQVTEGSNLYYTDTRVKTKLNDEGVISGSSQLISTFDTRYLNTNGDGVVSGSAQLTGDLDSRYLEINGDSVFSSSAQVSLSGFDTDNLSEGSSNLYYTDSRVKTKLNTESVISGSSQVSLSGFSTSDLSEGTNLYYTDTRVKTKLNTEGVISGSSQLTSTFDTLYLEINGDNVVSSSAQIDIHSTDGYVANEHIDHSTISVGSGKGLTGGGTIDTNRSITLDTGSLHFTDGVKEKINDDGVISGSSQVSLTSVTGYNSNEHFTQGNITTVGTVTSGDISAILPSGLVSGSAFSSTTQGTVRAQINGVNTDVDTGLQTGDSPTFQGVTLTNLGTLSVGQQTALFSGSAGQIGKRVLGTSAFFNVSASIADDPNSIPTTKAVNDALISAGAGDITEVNPSSVFSDSTTGLIHLATGTEVGGAKGVQGNIHIAVSTGSVHFTAGVTKALPSGVVSASAQILDGSNIISSSEQIDDFFFNIDGLVSSSAQISGYNKFLEINGDSVFSGSSQVTLSSTTGYAANEHFTQGNITTVGTVTSGNVTAILPSGTVSGSSQVSYDSIQNRPTTINGTQATKLSNISISQAVDLDDIETNVGTNNNKVGYTDSLVKTKLNTEGVLSGSVQITNGSGLVSSSAQIDSLGFLKVEGDSVVSSSAQIDYNSIQNQPTTISGGQASAITTNTNKVGYTDALVKSKLNEETVVSGSSQITLSSVTGYNSNEHFTQGNITTLGTVTSGNVTAILPSGVISGSTQLTSNLNSVYLEINGDSVVSGSSQINSLFAGTAVSTSLDSRLDSLESDTHTHSNKANLDTINQNLATTNNVTFADGDFTGDVQINGSLVVQGSATELQVAELRIEDKLITVASGSANSTAANGGGIEIDRGSDTNASILWNHTDTRFDINNGIHVTGTIKATDDIVAYASSDERLKNNIKPIENPLEKINNISGNTFDWNEEKQDIYKGKDYGVVAQEIEKILPELVHTKESGFKSVKYDKIIPLLIEGIKDLNKEVIELKKIIKESK
jgi:trimeric autotransporter adhesin